MDKIYFAGSITGGRDDVELYLKLIAHLGRYGKVLTEHIGDKALSLMGESWYSDAQIYKRDMGWLFEANIVVAEVTKVSAGVGYELGRITERNLSLPEAKRTKILCLYRPQTGRKLSPMIAGSDGLEIARYSTFDEGISVIDKFFGSIRK